MICRNLLSSVMFCLFILLHIDPVTAQERETYKYSFNGISRNSDNGFGWSVKNNTSPRTFGGDKGWRTEGDDEGYLGLPFDASTGAGIAEGLLNLGSGILPTVRPFSPYNYAVVGYAPGDYDDAHISKWLISRVFYGMKNGDKIKFRLKQLPGYGPGQGGNTLEVRLSIGDRFDSQNPDVGNTASSVGTFTRVLLTVWPTDFQNDWTEYEATISGLPVGKTASGRIAFRYHFENGGYGGWKPRRELPPAVEGTIDALTRLSDITGAGGNYVTGFQLARSFKALYLTTKRGIVVPILDWMIFVTSKQQPADLM